MRRRQRYGAIRKNGGIFGGAKALLVASSMLMSSQHVAAEAVSPRRLVEVADIGPPIISPDGKLVAFRVERASVERNDYTSTWYIQRMDGEAPALRVGDGGSVLRDSAGISRPAVATWSADGQWIYYRAHIDGRIDVWRAARDGSQASAVTRDPADVRDFYLDVDSNELRYAVGPTREQVVAAEKAEYEQGTRLDRSVPLGQGLYRSGVTDGRLATQRFAEEWFDRTSLLGDVPDEWKVIDLTSRAGQDAPLPAAAPGKPEVSRGRQTGVEPWKIADEPAQGWVAVLTRTGERGGLRSKPNVELLAFESAGSGPIIRCQDALCLGREITSIQWKPQSREVLFTVTDPGEGLAQSIYGWDVGAGTVHRIVRSDGLINGGRDPFSLCGVSTRALACVAAEAGSPPRVERVDLETGERKVLFHPNPALAHDMKQVPVHLLRWSDDRGISFTGQYFPARQDGDSPPPLFVSYYRCPGFLRGGMGDEWPLVSLAQEGISALCINAAPSRVDARERYDNGLSATRSAVDLLAARGEVDPQRVGFGGLSFGTEIAMWLVTESNLLAAASVSSPLITPNYYLLNMLKGDPFYAGLWEYWQLRSPEKTPERWRVISPVFKADRIDTPILFQMPEQEFRDSIDHILPLVHNGMADAWIFPHEPHQKFQPKHKLAVYERNLDWFKFWLLETSDEESGKFAPDQNWMLMREKLEKLDESSATRPRMRSDS